MTAFYHAGLGRFLAKDRRRANNPYLAFRNNPLTFVDADGHEETPETSHPPQNPQEEQSISDLINPVENKAIGLGLKMQALRPHNRIITEGLLAYGTFPTTPCGGAALPIAWDVSAITGNSPGQTDDARQLPQPEENQGQGEGHRPRRPLGWIIQMVDLTAEVFDCETNRPVPTRNRVPGLSPPIRFWEAWPVWPWQSLAGTDAFLVVPEREKTYGSIGIWGRAAYVPGYDLDRAHWPGTMLTDTPSRTTKPRGWDAVFPYVMRHGMSIAWNCCCTSGTDVGWRSIVAEIHNEMFFRTDFFDRDGTIRRTIQDKSEFEIVSPPPR